MTVSGVGPDAQEDTWTIAKIVEHAADGDFWIPHFQRGLVWNESMRAALLESLFLDTPCGSVVLWRPPPGDPSRIGVPLGRRVGAAVDAPLFIVDGQQRIRSLLAMQQLIELLGDHVPTGPALAEDADGRRWRINVARLLPGAGLEGSRELPLFVRMADTSTVPGFRNTIPVDDVIAGNLDRLPPALRPIAAERLSAAREELRKIRDRRLFVRILDGHSFSDVVGIYNRINSAGKRVEAEERALATLCSYDPKTNERLRAMYERVHDPESRREGGTDDALLRDETLQRKRERALGLKFMMRVFVQAGAFHLGLSVKASTMDLSLMDRWTFRQAMARADAPVLLEEIWSDATRVAGSIARVLRSLHCADFRFVPDATSLIPLAQILIRFPRMDAADAVLHAVLLRMFLEPPSRDVLALADEIRTTATPSGFIREKLLHGAPIALESSLAQSNSLQDRYLLLLAWLLKRTGATDFSHANLVDREKLEFEKTLAKPYGTAWEKQHIVPFAHAPEKGTRTSGPATNIGNMTFITSALNWALKDKPIDLEKEDPGNLHAHFLSREMEGDFRKSMDKDASAQERREAFDAFCSKRRQLIANGFTEWLASLENAARDAVPDDIVESTPFLRRADRDVA